MHFDTFEEIETWRILVIGAVGGSCVALVAIHLQMYVYRTVIALSMEECLRIEKILRKCKLH